MDELARDLTGAGRSPEDGAELRRLYESGDVPAVLQRLRRRRCELMDRLHEDQGAVDRLDFLLREMEKHKKPMERTDLT